MERDSPLRPSAPPFKVVDAAGNVLLEVLPTEEGTVLRLFNAADALCVELLARAVGGSVRIFGPDGRGHAAVSSTPRGGRLLLRDAETDETTLAQEGFIAQVGPDSNCSRSPRLRTSL